MATKSIAWNTGSGNITVDYGGSGNGTIIITTDSNSLYEARSQQITVKTTDGSDIQRTITIQQAAKVRIDISTAIVTAANQTYSGSAKTPTPTVTLNGETIPLSGYDVAYSNNTNAGTATITVTGKDDYTGTATGTFTIAKASRTISFANTYYVQDTSTTITRAATPSAGSGDGAITYSINSTTYATINSSSGAVTSKTSDGSATVTATIAEGTNYLSASTSYTLYVFATTHNYTYSGSYSSVTLPPGTYQFQCWGAQGGSNGTNSTYGITAKAGGKGGYSVGQLTVSQATGIRVYVGGQGSASAGGYNGGGSTTGTSQHNSSNEFGYSKMGGGGGATDIRLSDGALLSRMIVAGGGSGGAMGYKKVTSTQTVTDTIINVDVSAWSSTVGFFPDQGFTQVYSRDAFTTVAGHRYQLTYTGNDSGSFMAVWGASTGYGYDTGVVSTGGEKLSVVIRWPYGEGYNGKVIVTDTYQETTTTTETASQVGFAGGGDTSLGWHAATYAQPGKNGSFGAGANVTVTNHRYVGAAGGGGWYGGGNSYSDSNLENVKYSGGGSGFLNTASGAPFRPSGYTGLQLDSGTTYAGNTSFPSTSGGTETGHSGNGYARITRIS